MIARATILLVLVALATLVQSFTTTVPRQSIPITNRGLLKSISSGDNEEENAMHNDNSSSFYNQRMINVRLTGAAVALAAMVSLASASYADGQTGTFKFPPIDESDKERCIVKGGSSMGQANAARDKLYDLRQCKLSGTKAVGYDLSGVIMSGTDLSNANFREAYFSKGFLRDSNFDGADFSNAIVDRASFKGSTLRGTLFTNAVLTGTSFEGADVENADFTEAAIGVFDLRNLCKNPTMKGENPKTGMDTRLSAGCD